jgi:hypothetical protein
MNCVKIWILLAYRTILRAIKEATSSVLRQDNT